MSRTLRAPLASAALVLALTLPVRGAESAHQAIDAVRVAYNAACAAGDASALVALATEDAQWLPDGAPAIRGREAMKATYAALFAGTRMTLDLKPGDIVQEGSLAVLRGAYSRVDAPKGGKASCSTGHYVMVFRRQADGAWKITTDIWNEDKR